MLRTWFSSAASLLALLATVPPVPAATIVEKTISIEIRPDDSVREHTRLRVRLDSLDDLETWTYFPIYLDEHRALEDARGSAILPDGREIKVRRKDRDTMEYSGASTHSSARYHVLEFTSLVAGAEIDVEFAVETRPYYPADSFVLLGGDDVERLEVSITGGGDAWRFRIDGPADGFEVEDQLGGVVIRAAGLAAAEAPELAPGGAAVYPVLRYAWGREGSWRDVGAWYAQLLGALPRHAEAVRAQARDLIAGLEEPRAKLEALLGFARRKVRYVAVEVGIGGYLPSTPEEVLTRRWGDCKDKSLLLIDLLHEAGIEAYPALILADDERRVDVEFPSPGQFNHLIVAVPSSAVDYGIEDPVGDGYLFVDPTQERGSGGWLHPSDQDQDVLVVRDGTGSLARTPIRPGQEKRRLVVTLIVHSEGQAIGGAGLELGGRLATSFIEEMASAPPERMEESARSIFAALLPGVDVGKVGWTQEEKGGIPTVDMSASVRIENLVEGLGSRPSFKLTGIRSMPEPRVFDERESALVLSPRTTHMSWNLTLPEGWCLPEPVERTVENQVGLFRQAVDLGPGNRVKVERQVEIRGRWIEPELAGAAKELALEEHRAHRRRIRLECE